jgi:hypothetical protein
VSGEICSRKLTEFSWGVVANVTGASRVAAFFLNRRSIVDVAGLWRKAANAIAKSQCDRLEGN